MAEVTRQPPLFILTARKIAVFSLSSNTDTSTVTFSLARENGVWVGQQPGVILRPITIAKHTPSKTIFLKLNNLVLF